MLSHLSSFAGSLVSEVNQENHGVVLRCQSELDLPGIYELSWIVGSTGSHISTGMFPLAFKFGVLASLDWGGSD
ncbi:hypothetical protein MLD38_020751 [Melastoma candidum]|uniref:Uncharacterized protein n=1 Tax=Melastoma candidum TaxID=119954 RepID=A0ACB9QE92_9MYRT|nr:hypothetical protein MLD38_020751 [Melastoma candidum]